MSDEEYRQEGINIQLKSIKDRLDSLERWKKIEEEQHKNITNALDNFVIDAGAIGDSVYSNKLKSIEEQIAELKGMIANETFNRQRWYSKLENVLRKTLKRLADVGISGFIGEDLLRELDSKSVHNDPILKKYREKFKEMERKDIEFYKKYHQSRLDFEKAEKLIEKTEKKGCFMGDCVHLYPEDDDPCKDEEAQRGVWGKCHEFKKKDPWFDYETHTDPITKVEISMKKEGGERSVCEESGTLGANKDEILTNSKTPKFLCTLKEQEQCDNEGSMDCLKGNSEGERLNSDVCIHGKKELEKEKLPELCRNCDQESSFPCDECVDGSNFEPKTEPEKGLYKLHLNGDEFDFKRTTHPFTEYNNMVHRGIGMKLMPYNTDKILIEEFAKKIGYLIVECEGHSREYYHNKLIELKQEYQGG